MKIKIVKSSRGVYWYNVHIGEEFEVVKDDGLDWRVQGPGHDHYWVSKADAEIVQENETFTKPENSETLNAPVKSDGTSSSYYDLTITRKDGSTVTCTVQDIISSVLKDNWHLGNIFKAMVRIVAKLNGGGKVGTDEQYDANKIAWFAEDFKSRLPK